MKYFLIIVILLSACKNNINNLKSEDKNKSETKSSFTPVFQLGPKTIVYKTKSNYNDYVPVIMFEDKTKISSYPHQNDIKIGDNYLTPTVLEKGYLLDNKGINKNVAFLNIKYQDYYNLNEVPNVEELINNIIEKDPLIEMYDCGVKSAYSDIETQLNEMIKEKKLKTKCKIIK